MTLTNRQAASRAIWAKRKMKTTPFDPADYIDNEEAAGFFLAEAQATGDERFIEDAKAVVERARKRWLDETEKPS